MAGKLAGAIYISLQLKTAELQSGLRSAQKSLRQFGAQAQIAGRNLSAAFTLPLATLGYSAVKSFATFDSAMTRSLGIMGKAGQELKSQLTQGAIDISKTTKFSSAAAAEAYYSLAAAGFTAAETLKALPIVAEFAMAANMDLEKSSGTLVDILNAVGLASGTVEEKMAGMTRISNVLAKASMDTNVTIEDLSASLAGPLGGAMRQYGISVETGAAALEAFGSQGIKAKSAGTALSIVIRELAIKSIKNADAFKKYGISVYDTKGQMRNLVDVMRDMDKGLLNISSAERISRLGELGFTLKNVGFVQSVLGLSGAMGKWEEANKTMGYSAELAAANMQSFENQMLLVKHALENVGITIGGDLAPYLTALGKKVVEVAEWFQALPESTRHWVEGLAAIVAIGGPVLLFLGAVSLGISSIIALTSSIVAGAGAVALALLSPWIAIPAVIALATYAVVEHGEKVDEVVDSIGTSFEDMFPRITAASILVWDEIVSGLTICMDTWKTVFSNGIDIVVGYFPKVSEGASIAWGLVSSAFDLAMGSIEARVPNTIRVIGELARAAKDLASSLVDVVGGALSAAANGLIATGNKLGDIANVQLQKANDAVTSAVIAKNLEKQSQHLKTAVWNGAALNEEFNASANAQTKIADTLGTINGLLFTKEKAENQSAMTAKQILETNYKSLEQVRAETYATKEDEKNKKKSASDAKKETESRQKALEKLQSTLSKAQNKDEVTDIQSTISEAIEKGIGDAKYAELSKKLYDSVYQGYMEGAQAGIEKAGSTAEAKGLAEQAAAIKAQAAVDASDTKRIDANTKIAEDLAEKQKAAYDDSVSHFKDIFSDAMNAGAYDFKDAFKDILADVGSNLAAALSQALTSSGGVDANGNPTSGGGSSSALSGIVNALGFGDKTATKNEDGTSGIGPVADGDQYNKNIQADNQAQTNGDIAAGIKSISAIMNAKEIDKKNGDNSGTGGAVGSSAGTAIGAYFGSPEAGEAIGHALGSVVGSLFKRGSQNPETQARHAFANFVEEGFAKLEQVSFFDAKGKLQNMKGSDFNFQEGSTKKFNDKGWADQLNNMDSKARGVFLGLGEAMEEILGLTEDVGSQIALMLSENLGGNIDNARLLVMQLGLSMDEMIDKLVAVGKTGEMSWLEVETGIQGVTEAFGKGLVAVGDISGAFDEIVQSGGRGMAALKGVRDVAIEGMEAGATSLEDLKARLIAAGTNPEQVDALMNGIKQRGIADLQGLADASDRVLGGVVADMNASSSSLADLWAGMSEQIEGFKKQLESIPTDIVSNIKLNVTADISDDAKSALNSGGVSVPVSTAPVQKHAKGAVITGPIGFGGNHVMGEAGAEALMPLTRMGNGNLGIHAQMGKGNSAGGSPVNITVNAPYANAGSADHIKKTILDLEPYLTNRAVGQIAKLQKRGGTFARNF